MDMERTPKHLSYDGNGTDLAFLMYKNLLFTIFTLGIYAPWARTEMRRFIWGNLSYEGDRFKYTGQGIELFKGWLIVVGIYVAAAIIFGVVGKAVPFLPLIIFPFYIYLYALIVYGGTRYRLSRTKWREINFGLKRDKKLSRSFILLVFKGVILSLITLGFYFPVFKHNIRKFIIDKSHYGNKFFEYEAVAGDYFLLCIKVVALSIVTLGIYVPWGICELVSFRISNTRLDTVSFRLHLKGKDFFVYSVASYLLSVLTLGLATPWIINWGNSLIFNSIEVFGELNYEEVYNQISMNGDGSADVASVEYDIDLAF